MKSTKKDLYQKCILIPSLVKALGPFKTAHRYQKMSKFIHSHPMITRMTPNKLDFINQRKKNLYTQLVNAIVSSNEEKIENLIKEGVDLNARYYIKEVYDIKNDEFHTSWETSLTMAKDWRSSKKVVKILKDNGAQ